MRLRLGLGLSLLLSYEGKSECLQLLLVCLLCLVL